MVSLLEAVHTNILRIFLDIDVLRMCYTQFWKAYEVRHSVVFVRLYAVDRDTLTQEERSTWQRTSLCVHLVPCLFPSMSYCEQYQTVRRFTEQLCEPLVAEDYVIQSMPDVSPTNGNSPM